ncbi:MAG TPA: response regulator transcription factor, partial [Actinomycetota bacterium]|nr:response regulator transcription factor [Actinomycetota bacterium]
MAEPAARILVVEDEESLAEAVRYNLEREGYRVELARDGDTALERFRAGEPSLVILDLMLPRLSGLDVCRIIRRESDVPVIMLTAKDGEADKVAGLEIGADDYVTKPFSMRELVSRIRANLRRARVATEPKPADVLLGGPVEMDLARHEVRVRGQRVDF